MKDAVQLPSTTYFQFRNVVSSAADRALLSESSLHQVINLVPGLKSFAEHGYAGWGMKDNTLPIAVLARTLNKPFYRLEDGFIAYLTHPVYGAERFSMIVDDLGMYYDARSESRLERLINDFEVSDSLRLRAQNLLDDIQRYGISKYNHAAETGEYTSQIKPSSKPKVLLIDQTHNDCSICYGLASEKSFQDMLDAAVKENPDADIYLKMHPDVMLGVKKGNLSELDLSLYSNVSVLSGSESALTLLKQVDKVYTVSSQMGFEALLAGKSVVCFGVPFYSNWGLTDDRVKVSRRKRPRTLLDLLAIAYLVYPRYIHPYSYERCEYEDLRDVLIEHLKQSIQPVDTLYCVNFSLWKKAFVTEFLKGEARTFKFVNDVSSAVNKLKDGDGLLVWARKNDADLQPYLETELSDIPIWRMEDGFIRSVGLGVDLSRPSSLVVDRRGIYFDATEESELEHILNHTDFSDALLKQAQILRNYLLDKKLSKYNIGDDCTAELLSDLPLDRKIILVPGQVPGDASLKYGGSVIRDDLSLLKEVREREPSAYILYKPHPDVLSGNREGQVDYCFDNDYHGRLLKGGDIFECIRCADEVHTMTSLTGFEALLQGKKVVTYGAPLYASWGLTVDHFPVARRSRKLDLDMLVAGALILYPRYMDWTVRRRTSVFSVIENLSATKGQMLERSKISFGIKSVEQRLPKALKRAGIKFSYLVESLLK